MSDYRFGVDDYGLNYYPHDGVYDEEGIDWSKVERVEIDWVDFVRERTCHIEHVKGGAMYDVWRCSTCGYEYAESVSEKGIVQNYCPNCGAKVKDVDE